MSGTKEGAQKALKTIYTKHGADFFVGAGANGGKASKTGGFYVNRKLASQAGRIGGSISRRGVYLTDEEKKHAKLALSIDKFLDKEKYDLYN